MTLLIILMRKKDEVIAMLYDTVKKVFVKDNMILNFAGDGENFEKVKEYTVDLKKNMFDSSDDFKEQFDGWKFVPQQKNEAIVTSGQVQYVTMAGNYNDEGENEEYDGSFFVLGNIMRNKYLWNNIREKGGAYGCNCVYGKQETVSLAHTGIRNLRSQLRYIRRHLNL